MKNTLRKKGLMLLSGLVAMLIGSIASAQTQQGDALTGNQKQVVKVSSTATSLVQSPETTEFKRSDSGVLTSANGDVQVSIKNQNGTESIMVFKKPMINLKATDKNADMNLYIKEMKAWISHNPDFKNYLNAGQLAALGSGNLKALYLYDFEQMMKKNQSKN